MSLYTIEQDLSRWSKKPNTKYSHLNQVAQSNILIAWTNNGVYSNEVRWKNMSLLYDGHVRPSPHAYILVMVSKWVHVFALSCTFHPEAGTSD